MLWGHILVGIKGHHPVQWFAIFPTRLMSDSSQPHLQYTTWTLEGNTLRSTLRANGNSAGPTNKPLTQISVGGWEPASSNSKYFTRPEILNDLFREICSAMTSLFLVFDGYGSFMVVPKKAYRLAWCPFLFVEKPANLYNSELDFNVWPSAFSEANADQDKQRRKGLSCSCASPYL